MEEKQSAPANEKKPLSGFAKGWTIFMIVYPCAVIASVLPDLSNPSVAGLIMLPVIFLAGMIVGSAMMLKKRAIGYLVLLVSSILLTIISGTSMGRYTLISSGGLVLVFLTWLFTRKQIDYRFWAKRGESQSISNGFGKGWLIFMMVYAAAGIIYRAVVFSRIGFNAVLLVAMFLFCGMAAGSAVMLKKKAYGFWILLASSLLIFTVYALFTQFFQAIAQAGPQQAGVIFDFISWAAAPILAFLSWLFTRNQIDYRLKTGGINGAVRTPKAAKPARIITAPPPAEKSLTPLDKTPAAPAGQAPAAPSPALGNTVKQGPLRMQKKIKINWFIAGGVALFAIIIAVVLISLLQQTGGGAAVSQIGSVGVQTSSVPDQAISIPTPARQQAAEQPEKLTAQQQAVLEDIFLQLPEQMPEQSAQVNTDAIFQAALKNARIKEIIFQQGTINITLLFPDPMKLQSLNVNPYVPRSGAQAYIKQAYAKLIANVGSIQDTVSYDFNIPYQEQTNGEITYDKTLPFLFFPLDSYSAAFTPHMKEYMENLGFYIAASEILIPDFQDWDSHKGTEKDAEYLPAYFGGLANVLSDKGIDYNHEVTVDTDQIQTVLEKRYKKTWLFENMKFSIDRSGQVLSVDFPNNFSYFNVEESIIAQYQAGKIAAAPTLSDADAMYLNETRRHANVILAGTPQSRKDLMLHGDYHFDWETLGEKGIGACPDLVEEIRRFVNAYDFSFVHLAMAFDLL